MKTSWTLKLMSMVALVISYSARVVFSEEKNNLQKTYIVHMDRSTMPAGGLDDQSQTQWYISSLKSVSDSAEILYTYKTVIHGFSARLTAEQAESLQGRPGVLSVLEEDKYELHTTRTPQFLGLDKSEGEALFPGSNKVSEVIVGVLDTGVWPEIESFDDTGLGPVPSSWKGGCEVGDNFNSSSCNRKLIGARFFSAGYEAALGRPINGTIESKSPRDDDGHGTHTSTTAAGSAVAKASLFGYAEGTARGMATQARVASYKICWLRGCFGSDILAGMDKAVEDGVNIISLSIGGGKLSDYYRDSTSIGAFGAMSHGILVSCAAGNSGPLPKSLSNVAPWMTTVGAGTLDRDFPAYVSLGNGKKFSGVSLYRGEALSDSLVPLVYAGNVTNTTFGRHCRPGSLVPGKVAGKIVVCDQDFRSKVEKGLVVKDAGGVGMILTDTDSYEKELVAEAHLIPTVDVGGKTIGDLIKKYIFSDSNPTATISFGGTQLGVQPSPVVAAFSSRGPNSLTPGILKPDLIAPGVNIIAGWTGAQGPSGSAADTRRVKFNIVSGTSMACPHVSGLAALLKAAHPEWSPAAIRSALMTTAYSTYKNGETIQDVATGMPSTPFVHGAGHVNPVAALDPGLVYDATVDDYIGFLCALNYNASQIKALAKKDFTCKLGMEYSVGDLNYPSFSIPMQGSVGAKSIVKCTRTLTNVGTPATYKVTLSSHTQAVKMLVDPESLTFTQLNEKKNYTVTFTATSMPSGTSSFARLIWSDGKHIVGSPIAFTWA